MSEMQALTHDEANALLGDYVSAEISEHMRFRVELHVRECLFCQQDIAEIEHICRLMATVKDGAPEATSSTSLADAVLARLDQPSALQSTAFQLLPAENSQHNENVAPIRPLFDVLDVMDTEIAQRKGVRDQRNSKKDYGLKNVNDNSTYSQKRIPVMQQNYGQRKTHTSLWATLVAVLVVAIIAGSFFSLKTLLVGSKNNNNPQPPHHAVPVATPTPSPTSPATPTPSATAMSVTQPVPATQTDCPAPNTARAMVTAPLAQGPHPQIVYIAQDVNNAASSNRIMRYDTVSHESHEIFNAPGTYAIRDSILSADGQWVLFELYDATKSAGGAMVELRMVRVDGQGLQTLYCGVTAKLTWSPDKKWIAFDDPIQAPSSADTIHLINTTTGQYLDAVDIPQQNTPPGYNPRPAFWASPTQLYLSDVFGSNPFHTYLLDVNNGAHQALSALPLVSTQPYVLGLADGSNVYLLAPACSAGATTCSSGLAGMTAIERLSADWKAPQTIFHQSQLLLGNFSQVDKANLLVVASNPSASTLELWLVKADGSGATQLASAQADWKAYPNHIGNGSVTTSADGSMFAVSNWPSATGTTPEIVYGEPKAGGTLTAVPQDSGTYQYALGWAWL
ncbi:hypothetical protein [Dictyobacter formicarum]|uniref:Zinc-finger domain-containing protein n=1 Tax=Dictyobacter formicarum TaxID=2778368 RepID=A0ABQ3VFP1_9CHLR|nr:hypothetical protein [Dictyobacter formicarum]GHO84987.1 hypothetical protein KSZ_29930 [Dictyobacter formicarum]